MEQLRIDEDLAREPDRVDDFVGRGDRFEAGESLVESAVELSLSPGFVALSRGVAALSSAP